MIKKKNIFKNFLSEQRKQSKAVALFSPKVQRAYLSKLSVDMTLTLVDVYRIFQNILTLTLESVSFKSQNVNVTHRLLIHWR